MFAKGLEVLEFNFFKVNNVTALQENYDSNMCHLRMAREKSAFSFSVQ